MLNAAKFLPRLFTVIGVFLGTACQDASHAVEETAMPRQSCQAVAFYPAQGGRAFVRFTDQNLPDISMSTSGDPQVLAAIFSGEPGAYNYLIFQDGSSFLDPFNTRTGYSQIYQREVSQLLIPDCRRPKVEINSLVAGGSGTLWLSGQWSLAADGAELAADSLLLTIDEQRQEKLAVAADGSFVVELEGLAVGKHHLALSGKDISGREAEERRAVFWTETTPFTWQDANIYQVVVDRFSRDGEELPGTEAISYFHGGNLRGVTQKIKEGYFNDLAVNALWLSPLYQNPAGRFLGRDGFYAEPYHGYWPIDNRTIDWRFGSEADLQELVAVAHAHGIRILLDSVLNHTHIQNSYFVNHRYDGWYNNVDTDCICGVTCSWGEHYEDCWFDPFLADLSWQKEEQMAALVADHIYWLEKYDLDGLRMDAVPMMPRMAMRRMRSAVEEHFDPAGSHIYLIGEDYTSRGEQPGIRYYLGSHTLSGLFDYPVMWAIRQVMNGEISLIALNDEIVRSESAWEGSGAIMGLILGNHDVPRFISSINGDEIWQPRYVQPASPTVKRPYELFKLAWTLLYTLPGAPIIYYGDEIAMPGANDPDNRRDMRFSQLTAFEEDMLAHVRKVAKMRADCQLLRRGQRKTILANESSYVFARYDTGGVVLVVLNMDPEVTELSFELPKNLVPQVPATFTDLLSGESLTLTSQIMKVNVDQNGIKVLALAGSCGE